jgi:hypothetical protein
MAATSDIAVPKDGHFVDKTGVEGVIDIINETSAALQPESTFNIIEQLDPNFLLVRFHKFGESATRNG